MVSTAKAFATSHTVAAAAGNVASISCIAGHTITAALAAAADVAAATAVVVSAAAAVGSGAAAAAAAAAATAMPVGCTAAAIAAVLCDCHFQSKHALSLSQPHGLKWLQHPIFHRLLTHCTSSKW